MSTSIKDAYTTYKDFRDAALGQLSLKDAQKNLAKKSSRPFPTGTIFNLRDISIESKESPLTGYILGFEEALSKLQSNVNGLNLGEKGSTAPIQNSVLNTDVDKLISTFNSFYEAFHNNPNVTISSINATSLNTLKTAIASLSATRSQGKSVSGGQMQNVVGRRFGSAAGFVTESTIAELLGSDNGQEFLKTCFTDKTIDQIVSRVNTSPAISIRGGVTNNNPVTSIKKPVFGASKGQPLSDIVLEDGKGKVILNISSKRYNIKGTPSNAEFGTLSTIFGKLIQPVWQQYGNTNMSYYFYRAASIGHGKEVLEYLVAKQLDEIYFSTLSDKTNVIVINYYMMNMADYLENAQINVHGTTALTTRSGKLFSTPIDGEKLGTPGAEMSTLEGKQVTINTIVNWMKNRPSF